MNSYSASVIKAEDVQRGAWSVGALCLAIADSLQARFNPVRVRGELSNFVQAASGHCYFTLKDAQGQLRCAMFMRAASRLGFTPEDGHQVEVSGKLGVYEQRGDLQLVVESMARLGQGSLLEDFMRLKAKLEAAGLFSQERKRPIPTHPRGIGVVTSPHAAAWHDCMTALARRVPHVPVLLAPALVQGTTAPQALIAALHQLYEWIDEGRLSLDVILLVRGGGSLEDLWAFNDERLAYTMAQSPVPIVTGIGHETDFSIADFVADLRAPTPTAAAELVAMPKVQLDRELSRIAAELAQSVRLGIDKRAQAIDLLARRWLAPTARLMQHAQTLTLRARDLTQAVRSQLQRHHQAVAHTASKLELLHPHQVLDRGFAFVLDDAGHVVMLADQLTPGQRLNVHLAKGQRAVRVE